MCDRPARFDEADKKEIVITPAMIEAGAKVLAHFWLDRDDPKEVAREVFEDMFAVMGRDSLHLGER